MNKFILSIILISYQIAHPSDDSKTDFAKEQKALREMVKARVRVQTIRTATAIQLMDDYKYAGFQISESHIDKKRSSIWCLEGQKSEEELRQAAGDTSLQFNLYTTRVNQFLENQPSLSFLKKILNCCRRKSAAEWFEVLANGTVRKVK